ncbi:aldose 1-epimerase family protein [Myceligenerans xiligouense]|uniref:Aldose 1-epimerase n=1 Tax=Myceligenerans xiligouense TaxID=253184 RepID=A0A3N4YR61_9MICO|nr:aldose 1-epimerase family protein [Myceligenerans xiligouense]RPF22597.1 aldose 1-epimerase [Myceligenerans xiligouense]
MTDPQTVPAPSGTQHSISYGEQHVTVTEVGAALREYTVGGRDVVVPFGVDEVNPVFNGAVLLPWPNRLRDGVYQADGVTYTLPLTEPARGTALHGLAAWERWGLVDRTDVSVTLGLDVVPQPGYPFQLTAQITYGLSDGGLSVTLATTNVGAGTAPYGAGFHPWLSTGGAALDDCVVRLDAATRVTIDERLLPTGTEPVAGPFDMREPVGMAGRDLDDAFVDVLRDDDGLAWIRLTGTDGRTAAVWMDDSMDVWQACSGDHVGEEYHRMGLAAEPMTCYADAFATGDRLVRLSPGDTHRVRWGITLLDERRA